MPPLLALNRVVLVPRKDPVAVPATIRRYSLARLQVPGRMVSPERPFDHIRRLYD